MSHVKAPSPVVSCKDCGEPAWKTTGLCADCGNAKEKTSKRKRPRPQDDWSY